MLEDRKKEKDIIKSLAYEQAIEMQAAKKIWGKRITEECQAVN